MLEEHNGADNSAYRQLIADVVHYLVKGGMERVDGEEQQGTDWLAEFDPWKGGIVNWINDKIKKIVLPRLNDLKAGGQIYTNNAAELDANLANRLAHAPTERTPSPELQAEKMELARRYLGKLGDIEAKAQQRDALRKIEDLINYYELDRADLADSLDKAYQVTKTRKQATQPAAPKLVVVEAETPAAEPQASVPEPVEPLAPAAIPAPVAVLQPAVRRHRRPVATDPAQVDCFAGLVFEPRQRTTLPPRPTHAASVPRPLPRRPSWTKPNPLQGWLATLQASTLATRPYGQAPMSAEPRTAFTARRKRMVEGSPPHPVLARPRNKAGPSRQPSNSLFA